jgi:hypothetical protein
VGQYRLVLSAGEADADARRRFQREAQMAIEFARIVDHSRCADDSSTRPPRKRTWRQVTKFLMSVADALAGAHGPDIVRRDITVFTCSVVSGHARSMRDGKKYREVAESVFALKEQDRQLQIRQYPLGPLSVSAASKDPQVPV